MKTKNIFKALALAMLMPAMLLTTACSSDDDAIINNDEPVKKGSVIPVTINVSRQGDAATTRATYNESTKKLSFSAGDKLFVFNYNGGTAGEYAGVLEYVSGSAGTFSGTIYTENEYTGTVDALLDAGNKATAELIPAGYEAYGFKTIEAADYRTCAQTDKAKAFATTTTEKTAKVLAVEQFSHEIASYSDGFALTPNNAILNFTITGLTPNTEVTATLTDDSYSTAMVISGKVTTDGSGTASFAMGISGATETNHLTLTVDGIDITIPSDKTLNAGKIYNINRSVPSLADAFVNGNTTELAFSGSYLGQDVDLTLSATYNDGSFGEVTKGGTLALVVSSPSMARNGNNLVITITVPDPNNPFTGNKTGSMTINTVNRTYSWSNAQVGAMVTLKSITIGGNDIDLPTLAQ